MLLGQEVMESIANTYQYIMGALNTGDSPVGTTTATNLEQPQVIPSQGDLLGDLLNLDLGPPVNVPQVSSMQVGAVDLLGGGLDSLVSISLPSFSWWFLILDMLKNFK